MCGLVVLSGSLNENEKMKLHEIAKTNHRGPDSQEILHYNDKVSFLFQRLAIMDLSSKGNQPFENNSSIAVCNGEIYNYKAIKEKYSIYPYQSESDCEVLMPLWMNQSEHLSIELDAEYACVIYDKKSGELFASRDPIGIRPLFYGYRNGQICFGSEIKLLQPFCDEIKPFPPSHYYWKGQFIRYIDVTKNNDSHILRHKIYSNITKKLTEAVKKRMDSDAPMGFLLSGGLDSSLVCAIAARLSDKPIITFATGMNTDAIDTKYARIVADHIGSIHHEVLFSKNDVFDALEKVIWHLETWDITTIRASIGMYLVCKYIKEKTDIKVLFTGEISDELFGYKYTDFAPSPEAFQKEAEKRINELYMYDVLRADRCIAANSLEARVPFGDIDFVKYVMSIRPDLKMKVEGCMGKYLLREAFDISDRDENGDIVTSKEILPYEILWREKAAFSDAVGHSMVDHLKELAEQTISDEELSSVKTEANYSHGTPFTKESLMYRKIFNKFYNKHSESIKDFWMPNKEWDGCNVSDPSARVLKNYGKSGE